MQRLNAFALATAMIAVTASGAPSAQMTGKTADKPHQMMTPGDMKWGPAPPALPPGAEAAVLEGDPGKSGTFVVRLKLPDGYRVPPHSHPTDELVTVISGTLMAGLGDTVNESAMHTLAAGSFAKMPANANHYVRAKGPVVLQITATGPFEVKYVNPKDDPRNKATK